MAKHLSTNGATRPEPPVDIVICQALLYNPAVLLSLEADGGRFVEKVRSADKRWREWVCLGGEVQNESLRGIRGFEPGRVLQSLAMVNRIDFALCKRVHNHQTAADLGLDSFWADRESPDIRLTERSYSLVATDFGQFVLVYVFRIVGGTPETRSVAISRLCENRAIRSHMDQSGFTDLSYRYAATEIDLLFDSMNMTCTRTRRSSVIAPPRVHGPESWIHHEHDLTAFPWILSGRLTSEIDSVFSAGRDRPLPDRKYCDPMPGEPSMSHGNDFGFLADLDDTTGSIRYDLAPLLIFVQASYYKTRQLQRQLLHWMAIDATRTSSRGLEDHSTQFERLAHSFYRFRLISKLFVDSRPPRVRAVADRIAVDWRADSAQEILTASIDRHRQQLDSIRGNRAQIESRRQESILYVIAILQVFAIISVLADYRQLNPAIGLSGPSSAFELERRFFEVAPWLLRVLVPLAVVLLLWRFLPVAWKHMCRVGSLWLLTVLRASSRRRQRLQRPIDPPRELADVQIKQSPVHGWGLFACRAFVGGAVIIDIPEGDAVCVEGATSLEGAHWEMEWNARKGTLYVRRDPGTPYRFINHSRLPNVEVVHEAARNVFSVRAIRPVQRGEEILLDYRREPLPYAYIVQRGGYL